MIDPQRLDSVADITMGQAPDGDSYNLDGAGMPLIAGAGDFGEIYPAAKKFTTAPGKICEPGDIIIGIRATIGEKVVADRSYCLGRGVAGLRPKKCLDHRFLWHWLSHAAPALASKARGATFKQVNRQDIGELKLKLPRLTEQRQIAEILDKADALRVKGRAALVQLEALTQSIFLDIFGDLARGLRKWPEAKLGNFAEIVSGITKGRDARGKATHSIPYLAVVNVQDRKLNLSIVKRIDATSEEIHRYRLLRNDLLLTEGGDPDKLGRGTLWQEELQECIHQNHIFRVRITDNQVLRPLFLNWLIGSEYGKGYFFRSAKQTTGIASINMTQLKSFPLLLPEIRLQAEFETRVADVERLKKSAIKASSMADELFESLQASAFSELLSPRGSGRSAPQSDMAIVLGMRM